MVDDAIAGLLEGLDPHSFYIPKQEKIDKELFLPKGTKEKGFRSDHEFVEGIIRERPSLKEKDKTISANNQNNEEILIIKKIEDIPAFLRKNK